MSYTGGCYHGREMMDCLMYRMGTCDCIVPDVGVCPKCLKPREKCRLWNQSYSLGCEYDAENNPVLARQQNLFIEDHQHENNTDRGGGGDSGRVPADRVGQSRLLARTQENDPGAEKGVPEK